MEHTPMPSIVRLRHLDAHAWRTATWSAPFVVQLVLAALLILMWLLGKWPFAEHNTFEAGGALLFAATAIAALGSLAISGVLLLTSRSSRGRGLAVSLAGSATVVLIGGVIYDFWVFGEGVK
jgi:hypothetical protein